VVYFELLPLLARLELISPSRSLALSSLLPEIEGSWESVLVASSSSSSGRSSMSMGMVPGLGGLATEASGSISGSGRGWLVFVLGAYCSPVVAVGVRVSGTGGVGEGWEGVL